MGIDIVSYAMGAAGKAKIISAADWEAMTDEEKANYGVVALNTADSGYFRGYLVDGKSLSRSLLDISDAPFIVLEEFWDTFVDGISKWGAFDIHGSQIERDDENECIRLGSNTWLSADVLGNGNFTIYGLAKTTYRTMNNKALFVVNRNSGQHSGITTYYDATQLRKDNSTSTSINGPRGNWNCSAASFDIENGVIFGRCNNNDGGSRYTGVTDMVCDLFTVGAYSDGSVWQTVDLKYCAIVSRVDTDDQIKANQQKIMQYFGLGEV